MTVLPFEKGTDPVLCAAREAREKARAQIKGDLERLKKGSRAYESATRLCAELEALPKSGDPDRMSRCMELVQRRLDILSRRADETARSRDQRSLLIILVFGAGKLPREMMLDAFAILQLRGTLPNRKLIAEAFPGFHQSVGAVGK